MNGSLSSRQRIRTIYVSHTLDLPLSTFNYRSILLSPLSLSLDVVSFSMSNKYEINIAKWISNCPFEIFNFVLNCKLVLNSTESRMSCGCRTNQHEANLMSTQNFASRAFIHSFIFSSQKPTNYFVLQSKFVSTYLACIE